MKAAEIRQIFLDFFESKGHKIVPSAPIVIKDDPTLMFTNSGMNQFKDYFLGNSIPDNPRIADTQKCLRVSGKHNDLEEVGVDTYHHTMFEMLGNWSIGDYFKKEAIEWSWELLTKVYKLDPNRLYVTVFEGDPKENLPQSSVALEEWKKYVPAERIIFGNKKDNFWEMGEIGPCGPCSEIHIDLRPDDERAIIPGHKLVNNDHPQVIEIWNNVFIQYNRKADGSLEALPAKHVDTGMGFERLVRAIQGKSSNYDTDVFTDIIFEIEKIVNKKYTFSDSKQDIAFRVLADHIRAIAFTIADGQLPSNTGSGYVIRRILRRAVRYYYSHLEYKQPLLGKLVNVLSSQFEKVFPELFAQKSFVEKVIKEEESAFLKTLEAGLKRIDLLQRQDNILNGQDAFELYDTYGFPIDLTRLIALEKGWVLDEEGFYQALSIQKERSRADAKRIVGDWVQVTDSYESNFIGYDLLIVHDARVIKYRTLIQKDIEIFQIVLNKTPFYPEGGGQVGDTGYLMIGGEVIMVTDTVKENELIIHLVDRLPASMEGTVYGEVESHRRHLTQCNHSATHLLHAALRQVLGDHVQQKGSLVKSDYLRFDVSHYQKITDNEIAQIEKIVNQKIRENIPLEEARSLPLEEAKKTGAMMLFGEKYGDKVRMITFDPTFSRELCGGCHVPSTGHIGSLKIVSEAGIAAGVRRIEAVTADGAEKYINQQIKELNSIKSFFKNNINTPKNVHDLIEQNKDLSKEIDYLRVLIANSKKDELVKSAVTYDNYKYTFSKLKDIDAKAAKNLATNVSSALGDSVVLLVLEDQHKLQIMISISDNLTKSKGFHAGEWVKILAKYIDGGGGGQATFATAGGTNPNGVDQVLEHIKTLLK